LDQLLRHAHNRGALVQLPLSQLAEKAVTELAEDLLGAPPERALVDLLSVAEGNAGAVVALVNGLLDHGVLSSDDHTAKLRPGFLDTLETVPPPDCLTALLIRAVGRASGN
jgi:hypothetical protein